MPAKLELKKPDELLDEIAELRRAILAYLSEFDNPAPDPMYRKTLRDRLRKMVGAPDQPPPRSRK